MLRRVARITWNLVWIVALSRPVGMRSHAFLLLLLQVLDANPCLLSGVLHMAVAPYSKWTRRLVPPVVSSCLYVAMLLQWLLWDTSKRVPSRNP